jgi:hypothetical protein
MTRTTGEHRHLLRVLEMDPAELSRLTEGGMSWPDRSDTDGEIWTCLEGAPDAVAAHHIASATEWAARQLGCAVRTIAWKELVDAVFTRLPGAAPLALVVARRNHTLVDVLARECEWPVINAGTDRHVPLEVLADLVTLHELLGRLDRRTLGVLELPGALRTSWAEGGVLAQMNVRVVGHRPMPAELRDAQTFAELFGGSVVLTESAVEVVRGADVVIGEPDQARTAGDVLERAPVVMSGAALPGQAAMSHTDGEGPQVLLYHRNRNLGRVLAGFVASRARHVSSG